MAQIELKFSLYYTDMVTKSSQQWVNACCKAGDIGDLL